jgi:CDP-alcohol phosphatidyltransferase-like enzyme
VAELEDPLNRYLYHPLAFRLARLLRPTGISPNAVSAVSGALVCLAAVLYTRVAWPVGALAGFACHLLWHVADGADGDLARLTGKASPVGEFVDGAADYLSHIFLYVLLAAMLDNGVLGGWAWPLATVAGASRIAQANHAETQRRQFLWRVYGVGWLRTQQDAGKRVFTERGWWSRNSARVMRGYLALGESMAPYSAPLDKLVEAVADDTPRRTEVRARMRAASRVSLRLQMVLGANPRTILLGLSMIAGTPLWYFLIEAVVLNGVLAISVAHQNAVERRLIAALQ